MIQITIKPIGEKWKKIIIADRLATPPAQPENFEALLKGEVIETFQRSELATVIHYQKPHLDANQAHNALRKRGLFSEMNAEYGKRGAKKRLNPHLSHDND